MKNFEYESPISTQEAAELLRKQNAVPMGAGSDLLGVIKSDLLQQEPEVIVNLKKIPELHKLEEKEDGLHIGATVTLKELSDNAFVKEKWLAISEAAYSIATPNIRNTATVAGNICQDVRCWYYRYPNHIGGRINCARKSGNLCSAMMGENRYHSIFGGMKVTKTPCAGRCPSGTDIPGYMEELRKGNWAEAASILMRYNPMPMLTSRVCPHNCQLDCNQNTYGEPVNIHAVERSLGDYIMAHKSDYYKVPEKLTGKHVAVIGAGPGGLSAAFYLRKAGNEVTVIDRMEKAGGVLMYGIPHYRLPKHYVEFYSECLKDMGVTFQMNTEVGKDVTVEQLTQDYDLLYFGTGAWKQPILGIQGENLTEFGLNFLVDVNTYLKKAIGEEVLVCGGGNVAMDVALTAVRLGAKKVKLVCLEQRDEMPASPEEVARALEEGVEIHNGWGLSKIVTNDEGKVTGLESMKCLSVRNAEGRFAPQYDYEDKQVFESDYIILATGQRVDISFFGEKFENQLKSKRGLIDADKETYRTNNPKIYAGGDAVTGPNIAIEAIHAGRIAAWNMNRELGLAQPLLPEAEKLLKFSSEEAYERMQHKLPDRAAGTRTLTDEDTSSYLGDDALKEAGRCMNCGCLAVNPSDLATIFYALDAKIVTNLRELTAAEFFAGDTKVKKILKPGEFVTEIVVPKAPSGSIQKYTKFRLRDSIDFAILAAGGYYKVVDGKIEDVSLVLGAVAPIPMKMVEVEEFLKGKELTEEIANQAAEISVKNAVPLKYNSYKIDITKVWVKRFLGF